MNRKKILYVITKSNMGGAQRYVFELATSLPKDQYDIAVACGGNGILTEKLRDAGINIFEIKSFQRDINLKKEFSSLFELARIIRAFRPDIVHLNSSKAGGTGALVSRLLGVPNIIFTAHGWAFFEKRSFVWKMCVWILSYITTLLVHHIIHVSHYDAMNARIPGIQKKGTVIHTALPHISFLEKDEARMRIGKIIEYTIPDDAHWLISIGEYTHNKNLLLAIQAVHEVITTAKKPLYYVLIGADGDERPHLESYIKTHNLEDRIFLAGFIQDAREYLRAFDIFLMPSLKEGLPYAILEAGAAHLAVIGSDVGGIPEVITENETGIRINPNNMESIVTALKRLTEDAPRDLPFSYLLGEALQKKVATEYTLNHMYKETEKIYEAKGSRAS